MLRGRTVVLFPDVGSWSKWQGKAKALQHALGNPVLVSDWLERFASQEERVAEIDLADVPVKTSLKVGGRCTL